jgi:peptidyl-prolyl cis-trans isomerase C
MEKILARVGTLTVTESEVNEFLAGLGQRGAGYNTPEGRKMVLNQLINNKLLLQDARRNLYEAEAEFKAELLKVKDTLLINYAAEKAISGVNVKEEDVRAYYEENKNSFMSEETVNASHILVSTEDEAKEIYTKISNGEISFEDAAKEYSSCPSKERGGNLGDFTKGQMVPEFDEAAFSMAEGEVTSAPVKTQFGYHLIKLNSKSEATVTPFEELSDRLTEALIGEKRRAAYESKINQLKIMYPVDMV